MMADWGWGWPGGAGMGLGWLFMILFWVLVIAAIAAAVTWLIRADSRPGTAGESALDILQQRYARGKIGREEYEQKRADLRNERTSH